jgi:hypothetical protein
MHHAYPLTAFVGRDRNNALFVLAAAAEVKAFSWFGVKEQGAECHGEYRGGAAFWWVALPNLGSQQCPWIRLKVALRIMIGRALLLDSTSVGFLWLGTIV